MHIQIRTRRITLSRQLRTFITTHAGDALRRFAAGIVAATVELSDRNGRRGGGDKRCRIRISLTQGATVLVEHTQANIRAAIRRAASCAAAEVRAQLRCQ